MQTPNPAVVLPIKEKKDGSTLYYHSLTADPSLLHLSLEEIRLQHWFKPICTANTEGFTWAVAGPEQTLISNKAKCLVLLSKLLRAGKISCNERDVLKDAILRGNPVLLAAGEVATAADDSQALYEFLDTIKHVLSHLL